MTRIVIGANDTFAKWSIGPGLLTAMGLAVLLAGNGPDTMLFGLGGGAAGGAGFLAGLWSLHTWRKRRVGGSVTAGVVVALLLACAAGVAVLAASRPVEIGIPLPLVVGASVVMGWLVGVRVATMMLDLGRPTA